MPSDPGPSAPGPFDPGPSRAAPSVAAASAGRRRRGPRGGAVALALVLMLFVGAAVAVLLSARRIEGAVPGKGGLLSIAVTDAGYLVGTTTGAFSSPDGKVWAHLASLPGPTPVVSAGARALAASGAELFAAADLMSAQPAGRLQSTPTALAAAGGFVYTVDRAGQVSRVEAGGAVSPAGRPGPVSPLGLAVGGGPSPTFYAASLSSGLWRSEDGGEHWSRLLETPAQAVLPDAENPQRLLLGTPGGLLVSVDGGHSWAFSGLRVAVRGLARHDGNVFALTGDRLVLVSPDGEHSWEPLAPASGAAPGRGTGPGDPSRLKP